MGLDMYLTRKVYVGSNYEHNNVKYIEEEGAYWRKANHIHNWFVENVQDGVDNCSEYYVDKDQLKKLVDSCKKVKESLKVKEVINVPTKVGWGPDGDIIKDVETTVYEDTSLAEELLPTQSGFFFGGTEYDEWYYKSLEDTIQMLEPFLTEEDNAEYYYQSSW